MFQMKFSDFFEKISNFADFFATIRLLLYNKDKKIMIPQAKISIFSFINALVYVNVEQVIHKEKSKV